MSALLDVHVEIARERFLELLAQKPGTERESAQAAIRAADVFVEEYASRTTSHLAEIPPSYKIGQKLKGCPTCFGSGGPANRPCKACSGSGRVMA